MENASKAILIAGAILLVMAIIGIGMVIFSQTSSTIDNMGNDIDNFSISAHNSKFNTYVGSVTGSQVLECIQKALSTNTSENLDSRFKNITVKIGGDIIVTKGTTGYTVPATFSTSKKYTGSVFYNASGIIETIEFTIV